MAKKNSRRIYRGGNRTKKNTKGDANYYYRNRKNLKYYKKVKEILNRLEFSSIIDVGSRKSPMMNMPGENIYKAMLDIKEIPPVDGIKMITADFYTWTPDRTYDVAMCLQVLEHVDTPKEFAQKLLQVGKTVIISVPYKWGVGSCKYHVHDMIDEETLKSWVGRDPDESYIIKDMDANRIICVYK